MYNLRIPEKDSGIFIVRRCIADLLRAIVSTRRSVSEWEAIEFCKNILSFKHSPEIELDSEISLVLDILKRTGDIGFGTGYEVDMLFAIPAFQIEFPDAKRIVLGDWIEHLEQPLDDERLFPEGQLDTEFESLKFIEYLDQREFYPEEIRESFTEIELADLKFSEKGTLSSMEGQSPIKDILYLSGKYCDNSGKYELSSENAIALNSWLNFDERIQPKVDIDRQVVDNEQSGQLDEKQAEIAKLDYGKRALVISGPGTGKTFLVTKRIENLTKQFNDPPLKILVLSFTRVARAEIAERLKADNPNASWVKTINIHTLDSFAYHLVGGSFRNYDASIRSATTRIKKDPLIEDRLAIYEHILIDEAQDIVGVRKKFCEALIRKINEDTGVTILGDPAQAIYGYSVRKGSKTSLMESDLLEKSKFQRYCLYFDHRTKSVKLRDKLAQMRDIMFEAESIGLEKTKEVLELANEAAIETKIGSPHTHNSANRGLILVRGHASLLALAEKFRNERNNFRIKLREHPNTIEPIIGAIFGGLSITSIEFKLFEKLYSEINFNQPTLSAEELWKIFAEIEPDGAETGKINFGKLAVQLETSTPSIFVKEWEGESGPLLSTIHGVKGTENSQVMLLIPRDLKYLEKNNFDIDEETRIYYVGATRATNELRIGFQPNHKFKMTKSGRYWRPTQEYQEIEIGREGDLQHFYTIQSSGGKLPTREDVLNIWSAGINKPEAEARRDESGNWRIYAIDKRVNSEPLATLSDDFIESIGKLPGRNGVETVPEKLIGFNVIGSTSVIVQDLETNSLCITLQPLLGGFVKVMR